MNLMTLPVISLCISGCSDVAHNDLLGHWKSDEKKTLDSMKATPGITKKAKELFESDFFGKLIVEYTKDTYRVRFENDKDNIEELNQYHPYKVLEMTNEYYLVESFNLLLGETETKKIYKDERCYYELVSKWNFREYFCKIK